MLFRWLLAAVHLLAFGFALASILGRSWALRRCSAPAGLPRVFRTDAVWGLSALVLIITGGMRAFGGYEKGGDYYLHEPLFHLKMAALILILLLEIAPMMALMRWRAALRQGGASDLRRAKYYARIGTLQMALLIVMVFAASGMARGIGLPGSAS
jgi:putative membrane protein